MRFENENPLTGKGLEGKRIVVLARTPPLDRLGAEGPSTPVLEAEEAVMSLVRAVLGAGGQITLVADSSLALLAGVVAGEYTTPFVEEDRERPQSALTVFTTWNEDDANDPLRRLARLGYTSMNRAGETTEMLPKIARGSVAMVCVGTGSAEDVAVYREYTGGNGQVFVIAASGGGAAAMAERESKRGYVVVDDLMDREFPRRHLDAQRERADEVEQEEWLPPVVLSMHWIVEKLAEGIDEERPKPRAV